MIILGHSLGGRLALLSDGDYRIGISPALDQEDSDQTNSIINTLRSYRVRAVNENIHFEILKRLRRAETALNETDLVLFGSRDVPEIRQACLKLKETFTHVVEISGALHNDLFTSRETLLEVVSSRFQSWQAISHH